jgi:hypothetical protein
VGGPPGDPGLSPGSLAAGVPPQGTVWMDVHESEAGHSRRRLALPSPAPHSCSRAAVTEDHTLEVRQTGIQHLTVPRLEV